MREFLLSAMIIFSLISVFAQEADISLFPENTVSVEGEFSPESNPAKHGVFTAPRHRGDFWVCPGAETAFYSFSAISVGGSFIAAYGSKTSMGFKAAWFFDANKELDTLELNFLFRYYLMGRMPFAESIPSAGPYLQLTGGPALFFDKAEDVSIPTRWGTLSAGLAFGWRFFFGKFTFVEPYVKAGYPYIAGAGVSGGVRF